MAEDRERCKAIGMVDFIPKPVEPEDIVRVLSSYTQSGTEIQPAAMPVVQSAEPVLDLEQGLRRLDDDHALQQRLLLSFVETYRDLIPRLDALLSEGSTNQAIDLIHSIKGIASNLSAVALAERSRRLLEELRATAPLSSRAAFEATLTETLVQMQQHIADYVQPVRFKAGAKSSVPLKEVLLSLEPFVVTQEVVPEALLASLQQFSDADLPYSPLVREFQHHVDNFEHQEALVSLNLLKSRHLES
jgi:HPt (histidine-containing phosphotransfer) domain-containing protein